MVFKVSYVLFASILTSLKWNCFRWSKYSIYLH